MAQVWSIEYIWHIWAHYQYISIFNTQYILVMSCRQTQLIYRQCLLLELNTKYLLA